MRAAKKQGLRVTCEVTPHHFTLTDEDVRYDSHYKMNPPLASREDRDALIEGLADGSVDAIATDHAPHHPASKDVEFDRAPFGITGFETALGARLERACAHGTNLADAARWSYSRPGRRVFWDGAKNCGRRTRRSHDLLDRSSLDLSRRGFPQQIAQHAVRWPLFRGAPMATIVAGRIVYKQ